MSSGHVLRVTGEYASSIDLFAQDNGDYWLQVGNGCEDGTFVFPSLSDVRNFVSAMELAVLKEGRRG